MAASGIEGQESIQVDAPPEQVWALVSDVTRMGEWSPETVKGEWIDGASTPVVGARFKGRNKRGILRWSTKCTVVACEPGKEFSFVVATDTWNGVSNCVSEPGLNFPEKQVFCGGIHQHGF